MARRKTGDTSISNEHLRPWVEELRKFSVCQLADALGPSCSVETSIRPVDPSFRVCGPALTVECAPGDNLTVHHALHMAQPGDVLVVSASPNNDGALWGELMSISAQSRGLAGTIIDGPVRDPVEIQDLGYPVFCRKFSPRRAAKKTYGRINLRLRIGKISVNPRNLVVADANGIICIEPARAREVVDLASEIAQKESNIKEQIRSGRTIFEVLELEQFVRRNQEQANKGC
jgi:4-hydroxy-4-methyl-2-oxoglutarate aldolase